MAIQTDELIFDVGRHSAVAAQEHSFDRLMQRRPFSLAIPCASELPVHAGLPPGHFACFIAWDARGASVDEITALVEPLLRDGASYFVCWGPDCQRVHDVIDEIASDPDKEIGAPEESCIMTTWHDSEPVNEAFWFFLVSSMPDAHYEDSTRVGLAISVGSDLWAREITSAP